MLVYCFYRTDEIGTGTIGDGLRSAMTAYIPDPVQGGFFDDWINSANPVRYLVAQVDDSVLDIADTDPLITPISPRFSARGDADIWLDGDISDDLTLVGLLETDRYSLAHRLPGATRRHMLGYAMRSHQMMNSMIHSGQSGALDLFRLDVEERISAMSAESRAELRSWAESKNIDTGPLAASSLGRQGILFMDTMLDPVADRKLDFDLNIQLRRGI